MAALATDLQAQCDALRSKLKEWERDHFAKTGSKPGRKDVAANGDIATQYKEYEKLRSTLTGKKGSPQVDSQITKPETRKRKSTEELPAGTPRKRSSHIFATPSKQRQIDVGEPTGYSDVENTPQSIKQLVFGPTPQKNGIPMGIFDHITSDLFNATSSESRSALQSMNVNVARTPSKVIPATPEIEGSKFSRTPMSEGRRFMLDLFVTPRHKKQTQELQKTPSSTDKLFQTPAFLQRYPAPLATLPEESQTPQLKMDAPWKRRGFGRSLSSMIQELRKKEDDHFDHEMDIMRELEEEEDGTRPAPKPKSKVVSFEDITPVKETLNSKLDDDGFMPSDVEAQLKELDSAEAAAAEKSGRPLRIYKKKGLKRQTKRVNMRPVRRKSNAKVDNDAQEPETEEDSEDDEEEIHADIVPETQYDDLNDEDIDIDEFQEDFDPEKAAAEKVAQEAKEAKAEARAKATKPPKEDPTKARNKDGSTPKKKAADRNNYCKLKIKNKNSKANGRGRFARRR